MMLGALLPDHVPQLRPRHRVGVRLHPEPVQRRLLKRVRHPNQFELAPRRPDEREPERHVRARSTRRRRECEGRISREEAERD